MFLSAGIPELFAICALGSFFIAKLSDVFLVFVHWEAVLSPGIWELFGIKHLEAVFSPSIRELFDISAMGSSFIDRHTLAF